MSPPDVVSPFAHSMAPEPAPRAQPLLRAVTPARREIAPSTPRALGVDERLGRMIHGDLMRLSELAKESARVMPGRVLRAGTILADALANGHKILACGNGGSAADASHLVAELAGKLHDERRPLAAFALASDVAVLTCVGNDFGYEHIFARQVLGLGCEGDVLVALSTSGRSPNVLHAIDAARAKGMKVIGLTGAHAPSTWGRSEAWLRVPSHSTPRIQELHGALLHAMCEVVEERLFFDGRTTGQDTTSEEQGG